MADPRSPRQGVLAANRAFYAAFASLDRDRMAAVWLEESYVSCTHPGWRRILGWGAVMESWEQIFAGAFGIEVRVSDEVTQVQGDIAYVTCTEDIETRQRDGISTGTVEATNVFERRDGEWRLIHHHGSPLIRDHDPGDDRQIH